MKILLTLMLSSILGFSPLWPIGQNPTPGDPFIIVNKSKNQLTFVNHNQIVMEVPVATGKSDELTPEGLFTITVKAIHPYYRKKNIPGGAPNNPLGSRWIGFDANETDGRTYGIHGTNQPSSIGYPITAGCIRMNKAALEKLFDQVPIGTKLLIIRGEVSSKALAIKYGALDPQN